MRSVLDFMKIIWIYSWAILMSCICFFPMMAASLFSRTGNLAFTISKQWARVMLFVTGVRVRITGREKIKQGKQYVIISNHQSLYDIVSIVVAIGIQYRWVIKKEVLRVPFFGLALYAARNVFIDRGEREKAVASIRKGVARLPQGVSVLVFPEGTRSPDGKLLRFKKGGFMISVEKGLPVLPVAVKGSREILPKESLVFHPGIVEIAICDPIDPSPYTHDTIDGLIERTRSVIARELGQ